MSKQATLGTGADKFDDSTATLLFKVRGEVAMLTRATHAVAAAARHARPVTGARPARSRALIRRRPAHPAP